MKNKFLYIVACLGAIVMLLPGCKNDSVGILNGQDEAPSPIQADWIEKCEGTHGGAWIVFNQLPPEDNFLYVKAKYKVDDGQTIVKTMSVYSDTLWIEGLGRRENDFGDYEYEIELISVSRGGSESEPLPYVVHPLEPNIMLVSKTVTVKNSFASLIVNCVNELQQTLDVCLILKPESNPNEPVTKVVTTNDSAARFTISNLAEQNYEVFSYTKDTYNNYSDTTYVGIFKPLADNLLAKGNNEEDIYQWSWMEDATLYGDKWNSIGLRPKDEYMGIYTKDSMKNASGVYAEAKIEYFWDDITESNNSGASSDITNYFHTGAARYGVRDEGSGQISYITGYWAYPYSYFIDLGRTVQLSRVKVWQRYADRYQGNGTKTFSLWGRPEFPTDTDDKTLPGSDRLEGWFFIGRYTIIQPTSQADADIEFKEGHEFPITNSIDPEFSEPLRYLRFKGEAGFGFNADDEAVNPGSPYIGTLSEISLYGKDQESDNE